MTRTRKASPKSANPCASFAPASPANIGAPSTAKENIRPNSCQTLTREGFLSVLIPEEYGGSGLGLGAATAVLEEIHRSGCNGGACPCPDVHHGHDPPARLGRAEGALSAEDRIRRIAPAGLRRHRTHQRHRHHAHQHLCQARGRQIRRQRPEDLDHPAPSIPISWCCWCAPRRARRSPSRPTA